MADFTLNQTWPTFYVCIPVYKISIQYTNPFKRYRTETKSATYGMDGTGRTDGTDVHTDSGDTIWPPIENDRGITNSCHKKMLLEYDFGVCMKKYGGWSRSLIIAYKLQGPVDQSIISLMSSLRIKMLTVLVSTISYSQVFVLKKCE